MKTKFYKRLVPIALIASMAVTNVGMTSASAQEVTGAVAGFTQTVEGVDVGGSLSTPSSSISQSDINKISFSSPSNWEYSGSGEKKFSLTVTVTGDAKLGEDLGLDNTYFALVDSVAVDENTSTIDNLSVGTIGDNSIEIVANGDIFGSGNSKVEFYLAIAKSGTPKTWKALDTKITITKSSSGTTPTQQQAPATGFQIPGGLTSKGTTVNAYTVGVAKVTGDTTDLSKNVVKPGDIKEGTGDNTVGKWEGDYVGTGDELKLTPAPANAGNKYVLYYVPNGSTDPKFIRLLSKAEEDSLPKGDKLTEATLTKYTDKSKKEDKEASQQYLIETSTITGVSTTDYAGYKTMAELFGNVFELISPSKLNSAFNDTENGFTASNLGEVAIPAGDTKGLVKVPAVTSVAKTQVLIKDNVLVEELIKAYDEGKTKGSDTFADMKADENGTETHYIEVGEDGKYVKDTDGSYKISATGQTKLYEILSKTNFANAKKYMTAKGVQDTTKKLYDEVYARAVALYINAYNTKLASSEADLSLLNWVMETLPGDSETVTDKNGREKTNFTKANGSAAFWGRAKATATADSAIKTAKGASVKVTNTKAAGKFNAAVYLKAVSSNYVPAKSATKPKVGNVIFSQGVYITPAEPTEFTKKSLDASSTKADVKFAKNATASETAKATYAGVYDLTLDVGKSYKIPFALADGSEKDLVYKVGASSAGFTVIGGKVTGTDANEGAGANNVAPGANTVEVYSRANPAVKVLVNVKTNAAVKSIRANTTSLAIWPGSEQTVSLGTVPATLPDAFEYKATCTDSDVSVTVNNNLLVVKLNSGKKTSDIEKGSEIKVELWTKGEGAKKVDSVKKDLVIKLNPATAPQDVKSIKTAVKSKETDADGHKVINIPVGGAYNVGFTVAPATANGTVKVTETEENNAASVSGDVIQGVNVGHEQITFEVADDVKIADSFKSNEAEPTNGAIVYDVNVYNPGSSIILTDDDYTIKGGFLMTADAAATDCDKTFLAGKDYTMALPTTAGPSEDIVWAANNPAAVKFETVLMKDGSVVAAGTEGAVEKLKITPCQTGTFTITGTTKYTKQKLTFKMLVSAANTNTATDNSAVTFSGGTVTPANDETPLDVKIKAGDKINAYYSSGTENVGGAVTFALKTATDKDKLVVAKTGLITGKSAGKVTVVATMAKADKSKLYEKEFTVTVEPATVTPKTPVDDKMYGAVAGDTKGVKLATALNNYDKKTMTLVWYKQNGETQTPITALQDKLSGAVAFADADAGKDFTVYVQPMKKDKTDFTNSDDTIGVPISLGTVRVYGKAVNKADLTNGDKDTKTAIAALGAKVDEKKPANGAGNGHTYYFPVFVSGKGEDVVPDAQAGDMTFTVSNKSLATKVEFIPKSQDISTELKSTTENKMQDTDIVKNYTNAYGFIKVETAAAPGEGTEALSGVVTIKGTVLNSNKAVTLKLNLTGAAKDPATPYNPVEVTKNSSVTGASATFSGVTKLAGEPLADGKLQEELDKLDKGKTFTEYQWVVVKPNSKKYTKDDISDKVKVSSVTGAGETAADVTATIAAAADATEGTYYLAKATIVHKVLTAVEKDEDGKAKADSHAKEDEKAIKYTVELASKTPILVKAAATTGGNGGNG